MAILGKLFGSNIFGNGGQLSLSILISTGSYLYQSYAQSHKAAIEAKRQKIDEKIRGLYGPIVGNRILHR